MLCPVLPWWRGWQLRCNCWTGGCLWESPGGLLAGAAALSLACLFPVHSLHDRQTGRLTFQALASKDRMWHVQRLHQHGITIKLGQKPWRSICVLKHAFSRHCFSACM